MGAETALSGWIVETLRFTVFPGTASTPPGIGTWRELIGEEPQDQISRPRDGLVQESGPHEGGRLTVSSQPTRLDLLFTAGADDPTAASYPSAGPFPDAMAVFMAVADAWMGICPAVRRAAFGAVVVRPVPDLVEGNRRLSELVSALQIDPAAVSDLFFQVNRPRASTVAARETRINRLSKWSVATVHVATVSVAGEEAQLDQHPLGVVLRVEVDVNTAGDSDTQFQGDQLRSVWQELTAMGSEILEKGDIP